MGTCAGCILLSKDAGTQAEKTKTRLLGLMDMAVDRNAFGRQRESFEADLQVQGLDTPFTVCSSALRPSCGRGPIAHRSRGTGTASSSRDKAISSRPRSTRS